MTTTGIIITLIIGIIKMAPACIPTKDGKWLVSKFQTHPQLTSADTSVSISGTELKESDKNEVIKQLNEGIFLKKHYIFPGNEQLFLNPENGSTPVVINAKKGRKTLQLHVYIYEDHIDVVKQENKKVIAYSLRSQPLQQTSLFAI